MGRIMVDRTRNRLSLLKSLGFIYYRSKRQNSITVVTKMETIYKDDIVPFLQQQGYNVHIKNNKTKNNDKQTKNAKSL